MTVKGKQIMGGMGILHWLVVLAIGLLFFGNRLPSAMGDFAKGINNFKAGLKESMDDEAKPAADSPPTAPVLSRVEVSVKKDETAWN
jgi:sec-independent protein translocase protein TatA